ncbi:hypothetical protein K1719_012979 [Acacia pycnantha]|nr:hypothetical protein K1719_012979 [Acacia pycnantha]
MKLLMLKKARSLLKLLNKKSLLFLLLLEGGNMKLLRNGLPVDQRGRVVSILVYEEDVRARDPVNGCVGEISSLKNQVSELQKKLVEAQAQIPCIQNHEAVNAEKGKEAFETAQEKEPSVLAAAGGRRKHEAAEKRIPKFPFDLNELPSDGDEDC